MMDCIRGRTRRKTRSVLSRRRSPSLFLISFKLLLSQFLSSFISSDISHPCFTLTALSRPYIVYMLQDLDILEDWTAIRKVFWKDTVMVWCLDSDLICLFLPPMQAMASLGPHRVKVDGKLHSISGWVQPSTDWEGWIQYFLFLPPYFCSFPPVAALKPDRHHHVVRSEDGRLFYDNQWYCRGQAICINRKDEYPTRWVCESAQCQDPCNNGRRRWYNL